MARRRAGGSVARARTSRAAELLSNVTPLPAKEDPPHAYIEAAGKHPARALRRVLRVEKTFPTRSGRLTVVDGFDLKMNRGEFVSLIGHSGCGKSTVLDGRGAHRSETAAASSSTARKCARGGPDRAVVFQAPNLFPWLTAAQNVALGVDRVSARANRRRAPKSSAITSRALASRRDADKPASRSRTACANGSGSRGVALKPKLLLLDALRMLDSLTRWSCKTS